MGKYSLENDVIGKGATSTVYLAQNHKGEKVVIKKVKNLAEAEAEADLHKRLPLSEHIVSFIEFFPEGPIGNLVFEYHPGKILGHFKKGKPRSQTLAVQITLNILKGLKVAHESGILHCDLTPHNVLIDRDDPQTVKIIDFGSSVKANLSGVYKGSHKGATKWYRPPELRKQGNRFTADLNYSSDLYSAACICLYLLTGVAPFRKSQACLKVINPGLQKVLRKAVDKDKKRRFQTAQELFDALAPFGV
ncbi:serine/threonine-protein kinase [Bacillus sp. JJ1764]|uniref:serine/threonine-protein kinase n=1 Tax=Bacillus sp. JJ1764 TaxID=3122964 RepID=UPI002FFD974C